MHFSKIHWLLGLAVRSGRELCPKVITYFWTNPIKQYFFFLNAWNLAWMNLLLESSWKSLEVNTSSNAHWSSKFLSMACQMSGHIWLENWSEDKCSGCFVLTWGLNFSSGRFGAITQLLGYEAYFEAACLSSPGSSWEAVVQWILREWSSCCTPFSICIDHSSLARWQGH